MTIAPSQAVRIRGLADAGYCAAEIAAMTGVSAVTVKKYAGDMLADGRQLRSEEARKRHRDIAIAYDLVAPSQRERLAQRFGVASPGCLRVLACYGRKLIREDGVRAEARP